ncbi:uncharacterized protein LOC115762783 [Drosophila novamexicana]|uniref:uncharacterized protein LOC115762783 n=1 Tax=Drosophila novamexicana TaxID=47314 RepID=UPI0011E5EBD6|nr:uncharacterized protein LOC115762783 [Drosophila novamexicana]
MLCRTQLEKRRIHFSRSPRLGQFNNNAARTMSMMPAALVGNLIGGCIIIPLDEIKFNAFVANTGRNANTALTFAPKNTETRRRAPYAFQCCHATTRDYRNY